MTQLLSCQDFADEPLSLGVIIYYNKLLLHAKQTSYAKKQVDGR